MFCYKNVVVDMNEAMFKFKFFKYSYRIFQKLVFRKNVVVMNNFYKCLQGLLVRMFLFQHTLNRQKFRCLESRDSNHGSPTISNR